MIPTYCKIWQLGHREARRVFDGNIEVTEKVDGSQFGFGKLLSGELVARSKGKQLFFDAPEELFKEGLESVQRMEHLISPGWSFYAEYLKKPKHNVLAYDRIPKNHLALFAAFEDDNPIMDYTTLEDVATMLDIDVVPKLYSGPGDAFKADTLQELNIFLGIESFLRGEKIEGIVIKNYHETVLVGGQYFPLLAAKFVSDGFKERHNSQTPKGKNNFQAYCESFRTEARWLKAIQHLRDNGELKKDLPDIGPLMNEIRRDIKEEHIDEIKAFLYQNFKQEIMRKAVAGFPEWYKKRLVEENFNEENTTD
jgi:hypothetical protein